jgi:outer membrane biosynthesis protein TonB
MRSLLIAGLLLTPMLFIAPAVASQPKSDSAASAQVSSISNGVIEPLLIHSAPVLTDPNSGHAASYETTYVLQLNIDITGEAQDIRILKSSDPLLNDRVIEAVQQFRWQPATLKSQPVPFGDVTLNIVVQR